MVGLEPEIVAEILQVATACSLELIGEVFKTPRKDVSIEEGLEEDEDEGDGEDGSIMVFKFNP